MCEWVCFHANRASNTTTATHRIVYTVMFKHLLDGNLLLHMLSAYIWCTTTTLIVCFACNKHTHAIAFLTNLVVGCLWATEPTDKQCLLDWCISEMFSLTTFYHRVDVLNSRVCLLWSSWDFNQTVFIFHEFQDHENVKFKLSFFWKNEKLTWLNFASFVRSICWLSFWSLNF